MLKLILAWSQFPVAPPLRVSRRYFLFIMHGQPKYAEGKSLMHIIAGMLLKFVRILFFFFFSIIRLLSSFHRENILVTQGSKYNYSIIISQCGSQRLMRFGNLYNGVQAQLDLKRMDYPYTEYIRLMIMSLIYYPFELYDKNILIIGLGGGILPRAVRKLCPTSQITISEIDPLVNEIAKKYFYFKEDSKMKVLINDGRVFLKTLPNTVNYDIIFFDAYTAISGLPSHMKTREFFLQLKCHLNPNGGLLIMNLVCIYESYIIVRQTVNSVFDETNIITFRSADLGNMVTVASSSIENFPSINQKSNITNDLKQKLLIDVHSLLKRKQKPLFHQDLSPKICTDDEETIENEQEMSLAQFVSIV